VFGHGFTYSGHPVSAAVALEALTIYEERDIVGHVRAVSPVLQDGLRGFADHPLVGNARGVGLVGAVEVVKNKDTKESFDPAPAVAARLAKASETHGLIVRALPGDIVAFSPPLVIEAEEIEEMIASFGRALDDTWTWARKNGLL
jgi:4-aminobutyrate--pyruvate transaminase